MSWNEFNAAIVLIHATFFFDKLLDWRILVELSAAAALDAALATVCPGGLRRCDGQQRKGQRPGDHVGLDLGNRREVVEITKVLPSGSYRDRSVPVPAPVPVRYR